MHIEYYKKFRINIHKPEPRDNNWLIEWDLMISVKNGWDPYSDDKFIEEIPNSYPEDNCLTIVLNRVKKYIDKNL